MPRFTDAACLLSQGCILAPGLILTDSPMGIRRALAMPSYCEAMATGSA